MRRKLLGLIALTTAAVLAVMPNAAPAQAAGAHALVQGSGSSWAANAVNQWIKDVKQNGLQVVFTPNGSAQGRKDYANNQADYAISDIGYQGIDSATGSSDTSQGRAYAYLPIVGGGTSFPYQVRVRGQLLRNLRLSGTTLARIFTNQITNWNDAAITKDNNGRQLPDLPIIPVVHSEGSGSTYQFTRYLATEFPKIWTQGATEYFKRSGPQIAENGSDSMINFITSGAGNGSIGYDEYSYALGKNYPVAKLLNTAGYFTLPNQYNVAVALTKAVINTDKKSANYLLQNLDNVYTYNDPRVYPLSSYSYMIIPTSPTDKTMSTAKRQTIADYLYYSICGGQKEMGPIGYSPLPINLVQAGFQQIALLHTADTNVQLNNENVTTCHNPTFVAGQPSRNYLAEIAPQPPACDKSGAGPCAGGAPSGLQNPTSNGTVPDASSGGSSNSNASGSGGGGSSSSGSGGGSSSSGSGGGSGGSAAAAGGKTTKAPTTKAPTAYVVDPATGQQVAATDQTATNAEAYSTSTVLTGSVSKSSEIGLAILCSMLLIAALVAPPLVAAQLRKRSDR
jgi:phosphate transport system substrate-binding protein